MSLPQELYDDHESSDGISQLMALHHRMQIATYSTAFSGVDTPGTAFAQLRAALAQFLVDHGVDGVDGVDSTHHPQHLHGIVS